MPRVTHIVDEAGEVWPVYVTNERNEQVYVSLSLASLRKGWRRKENAS